MKYHLKLFVVLALYDRSNSYNNIYYRESLKSCLAKDKLQKSSAFKRKNMELLDKFGSFYRFPIRIQEIKQMEEKELLMDYWHIRQLNI